MVKFHTVGIWFKCSSCDFITEKTGDLKRHNESEHDAEMETDTDEILVTNKESNKRGRNNTPCSSPPSKKVEIEEPIVGEKLKVLESNDDVNNMSFEDDDTRKDKSPLKGS